MGIRSFGAVVTLCLALLWFVARQGAVESQADADEVEVHDPDASRLEWSSDDVARKSAVRGGSSPYQFGDIPKADPFSREYLTGLLSNCDEASYVTRAHDLLPALCQHFQLVDGDGTEVQITREWKGSAYTYHLVQVKEVARVATLLHAKHPELVAMKALEQVSRARLSAEERLQEFRANLRNDQ